jgi:NADH:ubiquinone oxidoreductase subunit F (NADH-binding)
VIVPPEVVEVRRGPLLLAGSDDGPGHEVHLARFGPLPRLAAEELVDLTRLAAVRGRGGAGFPLARKLETVLGARGRRPGRRPVVVVNAAEGEPASAKDEALLRTAPHLVLDGAVLAARALGARHVHVVTSEDRPQVGHAVAAALRERDDSGIRWSCHVAPGRFVAGQARAVLELIDGRPGLPVTAWAPEALDGHRGRPTLLSNAESWAHLGAVVRYGPDRYASHGTTDEPGTTLLTLSGPPDALGRMGRVRVVEVEHGQSAWSVLGPAALAAPLLVGGFHGQWVHADDVPYLRFSAGYLRGLGLALGAGAVLSLGDGACPVDETARYTGYLAAESAGRCGPCRNGLPALADEVRALAEGADTRRRLRELTGLVTGRGACAHPDGTARLVTSLLTRLEDVVEGHLVGICGCPARQAARLAVAP